MYTCYIHVVERVKKKNYKKMYTYYIHVVERVINKCINIIYMYLQEWHTNVYTYYTNRDYEVHDIQPHIECTLSTIAKDDIVCTTLANLL